MTDGGVRATVVTQLDCSPDTAIAVVRDLVAAYLDWAGAEQVAQGRFTAAELPTLLARVQDNVRAELPAMLGPGGRLLVALDGQRPVGLGGLKPVDERCGEIKRMFVDPLARGRGIGAALLKGLIAAGAAEGYAMLRLETADFMAAAHALYRRCGFVEVPIFDGGEAAAIGLNQGMHFLQLSLTD